MSQSSDLVEEATIKERFKEIKTQLREWEKGAKRTEAYAEKEKKYFERVYDRKVKTRKATYTDHTLAILTARSYQYAVVNSFLLAHVKWLVGLSECLVLDGMVLGDDHDKLVQKFRERRKLELKVPKAIGDELKAWTGERERQKRWQRANR